MDDPLAFEGAGKPAPFVYAVRMALDPRLLEIICCPDCRGDLEPRASDLKCRACGLVYPIEDGIPVLLVDRAVKEA